MGESACLISSFSHPSDASREMKEGDPIRVLSESISFGRFMSESLAWEKWSSFTHNCRLEEVEKLSKPGSVAQKKAFFEAHYKRLAATKKAADLATEANSATSDVSSSDRAQSSSSIDSKSEENSCQVAIDKLTQNIPASSNLQISAEVTWYNSKVGRDELEDIKMEGTESTIDGCLLVENNEEVENSDQVQDFVNYKEAVTQREMPPKEDAADQESMVSAAKKRQEVLASNASTKRPPSAKPFPPIQPSKESRFARSSKKFSGECGGKNRTTLNSLHMSINFTSCGKQISTRTSPIAQKIGNPRVLSSSIGMPRNNSTPPHLPTKGPFSGLSLATSLPESRSGVRSSISSGSKARCPTVFSPFSFKSEERAAKRREKLEEKMKAKEDKVPDNDLKKTHKCVNLKTKPVHHELEAHKNHKKVPPAALQSPKPGRKHTPTKVQYANSRPLGKPFVVTEGSECSLPKKDIQRLTRSAVPLRNKNARENASPNIRSCV